MGSAICSSGQPAKDTTLGLATVATVVGAHAILMRHGSRTLRFAALTGLIQHRLERPHGHPQKPADLDRGEVAARSGVIGPIAAQSEIFLPGGGDRKRKQGFFAHNAIPSALWYHV